MHEKSEMAVVHEIPKTSEKLGSKMAAMSFNDSSFWSCYPQVGSGWERTEMYEEVSGK